MTLPYSAIRHHSRAGRFALSAAAAAATVAAIAIGAVPLPAQAALADGPAAVNVTLAADPSVSNTAFTDAPAQLNIAGSGFQSIQNGFGGIYLLFGWVDPSAAWQPSQGGTTGGTYQYAIDDETNPAGYQQFIAFPGSSTEGSATGGEVNADGTFTATLTVAGPTFEAADRDGNVSTVDCRTEQCGIITIGAHGVANSNNETFTPITFVASASASPSGAGAGSAPGGASTPDPDVTTFTGDAAGNPAAGGPTGTDNTATAAPVVTDASADAGPSGGTGWMIDSGIALAALLGIGVWRLLLWRRRRAAPPSRPARPTPPNQ
jgi:hypothetical protein